MKQNLFISILAFFVFLGAVLVSYDAFLSQKPIIKNTNNSVQTGMATVSLKSIANDTSSASAVLAGTKIIAWQTKNYPNNIGVDINLIRKISDNPKQFEIVRNIAKDTLNDGVEVWSPKNDEYTKDLYVEVTCSGTYQFVDGCSLSGEVLPIN